MQTKIITDLTYLLQGMRKSKSLDSQFAESRITNTFRVVSSQLNSTVQFRQDQKVAIQT